MSRLEVPRARTRLGAAPRAVAPASSAGVADAASRVGATVAAVGRELDDRLLADHEMQATTRATELLGEQRMAADTATDPAAIDAAWSDERIAGLRKQALEGLDPRIERTAGAAFDRLAARHKLGAGRRALELRGDAARAGLVRQRDVSLRPETVRDPGAWQEAGAHYTAALSNAVQLGYITHEEAARQMATFARAGQARQRELFAAEVGAAETALADAYGSPGYAARLATFETLLAGADRLGVLTPEQAQDRLRRAGASAAGAAALSMLIDAPEDLAAGLRDDAFPEITGADRQRLRARAQSEVARREAVAERAAATETRARDAAISQQLRDATAIVHNGQSYALEAELLDSEDAQGRPEFSAFAGAVALRDALPTFAVQPPAEMRRLIAEERSRPLAERHETKIIDAMEAQLTSAEAGWRKDPITYAHEIGVAPQPNPLPEDLSDPGPLAQALAER
ncbi:MAG: hypothetical protein AAF192_21565, partial [Pseudomonadota bacterium]